MSKLIILTEDAVYFDASVDGLSAEPLVIDPKARLTPCGILLTEDVFEFAFADYLSGGPIDFCTVGGSIKSYLLRPNGNVIGFKINIPKDRPDTLLERRRVYKALPGTIYAIGNSHVASFVNALVTFGATIEEILTIIDNDIPNIGQMERIDLTTLPEELKETGCDKPLPPTRKPYSME